MMASRITAEPQLDPARAEEQARHARRRLEHSPTGFVRARVEVDATAMRRAVVLHPVEECAATHEEAG